MAFGGCASLPFNRSAKCNCSQRCRTTRLTWSSVMICFSFYHFATQLGSTHKNSAVSHCATRPAICMSCMPTTTKRPLQIPAEPRLRGTPETAQTSRGRWAFPAAATFALASRTGNVSEHRGALARRNRGPASLGPATSACLFEFGTGFLPSDTGAPKGGLKTMSPRRDRKSETTTREKWPQRWLFC